jgi:hypothetical protein
MHFIFTTKAVRSLAITGGFSLLSILSTAQALSGYYTIDATQPASSTNFSNFNSAVNSLVSNGVSGAVTFQVSAHTYVEQVTIPAIGGASGQNTITFIGNESTIQNYSGNTNERAVIKLNGASYINIKNINIAAGTTATSTYGYGIQLMNNSDNNTISNCNIVVPGSYAATTASYAGIVINSDPQAILTEGNADCDHNVIDNNVISGGNNGISLVANGSVNMIHDNVITNNRILDFFNTGIYLDGNVNTLVDGNDISRPTRSIEGLFYGIQLNKTSYNTIISKNKIHDPFGGSSNQINSGANGIYFTNVTATEGRENRCFNNIIYNIKAGSIVRGVWLNSSPFSIFQNNTISFDDADFTGFAGTAGFETYTSPNLTIQNNIVTMKRTGGTRTGLNITVTTGSIITNNDVYATSGSTFVYGVYGSTSCTTLTQWAATSGDNSSQNEDPQYTDMTNGNLKPNNQNLASGTPTDVTTDILGLGRNSTPTLGAFEMNGNVLPIEMSLLSAQLNANNEPVLIWKTFTEAGNEGFNIQRSDDGKNWNNIAFIESKNQSPANYNFTDHYKLSGKMYYRIAQQDENGTENYSNIAMLIGSSNSKFSVMIFPNPSKNIVSIQTVQGDVLGFTYSIFNQLGQKIISNVTSGNTTAVNISNLATGLYFVKIQSARQEIKTSFIKE